MTVSLFHCRGHSFLFIAEASLANVPTEELGRHGSRAGPGGRHVSTIWNVLAVGGWTPRPGSVSHGLLLLGSLRRGAALEGGP